MSIAKTSRPRRPPRSAANSRRRVGDRGEELAGLAPGGRRRPPPGRRRRRRPSRSASRAATCRRTARGRGRRGSRRATRASRSPPSRSAAPPARPRWRPGASASSGVLVGALVDAEPAHAVLGEPPLEAGLVGALGQPEAAVPAEAPAVRADAGVELQPQCPRGVASSGSTAWVAAEAASATLPSAAAVAEGPQRVAARRVEQLERAPVAGQLRLAGGPALGRHLRQRRPRRRRPATRPGTRRRRSRTPASSSWSARTGVTVRVTSRATSSSGR